MKYIKHLTKIEIVGTDLIRGYYEEMMYEVHLNGMNYQALETEDGLSFVDEHDTITKTIFKELEEYLQADSETRIEMLGADKLVKAINNALDENYNVVATSTCPEVVELADGLESFLNSLSDGQLIESVKEIEKVLQDFYFYANIEKEKVKADNLAEDFHELITQSDRALRVLRDMEQTPEVLYYRQAMLDALDYAYDAMVGAEDTNLLQVKLRLAQTIQEHFGGAQ